MVGFFSIDTTPPLLVQKLAAGEPDWVEGYSIGFWTVELDHGRVQPESTTIAETIRSDDRIVEKKKR